MIYRYPDEVHEFVKENCTKMRDRELAEACNKALGTEFTAKKMRSFRHNHGYQGGLGKLTKEEWRHRSKWPDGFYEYVRDNSYGIDSVELSRMIKEKFDVDITPQNMKAYCQRHGIKRGITGWFQKGHSPATKGMTIEEICGYDPEKLARVRSTQFKKGEPPANEMPIGSIVVTSHGYKLRKRQMEGTLWERWEFLHRAVWEEHNGPIPENGYIIFKDGDKLNCNIDNLMLISRAENAILNRMKLRSEDPDLTEAGVAVARLRVAIKEKRKLDRGEVTT